MSCFAEGGKFRFVGAGHRAQTYEGRDARVPHTDDNPGEAVDIFSSSELSCA
jgi:hypothetical protein